MSDVKVCCVCKVEKSTEDFSKNSRSKDSLDSRCKSCRKEWLSAYAKTEKGKRYKSSYSSTPEYRYSHSRHNAKNRGIDFLFTLEEYSTLVETDVCNYCNRTNSECKDLVSFINDYEGDNAAIWKLKKNLGSWAHKSDHLTVDRKDSFGPYSDSNCVVCCSICNAVKGWAFSYELFAEVAPRLIADMTAVCVAAGFGE